VQCICIETKKAHKKETTHIKHPQVSRLWLVLRKIYDQIALSPKGPKKMFSFMVAVAAGFIFLITRKIDEVTAATKLQKDFCHSIRIGCARVTL
jgi:hypothetical protein